mgnify:FL=1
MKKKQKLFLASGLSLSLLVGIGAVMASKGATGLFGEDVYPSVKTNTITFTADDFANGTTTIIKNGNPFTVSGDVSVSGGVVTFAMGASLTRASTEGPTSGMYKGAGLFYEMSVTGLDVAKPSQSVVHAGRNRTWYKVINDRGDGDGRGLYASAEEADKVGYHNISHTWSNNRDDNDPSSFWIETDNPTLTASGGAFSFKTLTYKYVCTRTDATYQRIMANNKRGAYRFTDVDGNNLPALAEVGKDFQFKVEMDSLFAKEKKLIITYSNDRAEEGRKTIECDENGIYTLKISNNYGSGESQYQYTYLYASPVDKDASPVGTLDELKAMDPNGNYYLTNDIEVVNTFEGSAYGCLGMEVFSGVLDGKGHRLYSKTPAKTIYSYGLFKTFDGIIRNLDASFTALNYDWNPSGLVGTMNGGLIENVNVNAYFFDAVGGRAGGIAQTMNGGTIRNSDVHLVYTVDIENSAIGAIVGDMKGGNVENVTVHTQFDVEPSAVKLADNGDLSKFKNCEVQNDYIKAADSVLGNPTATEETYHGMPVTKIENVKNYSRFLNYDFSLLMMDKVGFYLKSDKDFNLDGASVAVSADKWTYVEFSSTGEGTWDLYAFSNTANIASRGVDAEGPKMCLRGMTGMYNWDQGADYAANILATPLYVTYKQTMGTKVADSILTEAETVTDSLIADSTYREYTGGNFPIADIAAPKKGETMRFAMRAKIVQGTYDYFYLMKYEEGGKINADDYKVSANGWTVFTVKMEEAGTYAIDVLGFEYVPGNIDTAVTRKRSATGVSMTKLGDYFSIFPWQQVGIYSTPIFVK